MLPSIQVPPWLADDCEREAGGRAVAVTSEVESSNAGPTEIPMQVVYTDRRNKANDFLTLSSITETFYSPPGSGGESGIRIHRSAEHKDLPDAGGKANQHIYQADIFSDFAKNLQFGERQTKSHATKKELCYTRPF